MPLVSVIIPCYNHGHYLGAALESVLAQTFAHWEAIVVDDGSTDSTAEVGRAYGERDGRIRYVYQENRGLSGARNTGIANAQGEYLAFLDADDEWEPAFLQACVDGLRARPELAGVYTLGCFIDEQGRVLPRGVGRPLEGHVLRQRLLEGGFFPVHSVLVRACAVREAGCFDESLASVEDWDLWLRLTSQHEMAGIDAPLVRYRIYAGSMSTNAERMHRNRMAVLTKHFGPATGEPADWPDDKRRAYAYACRAAALGYIAQGQAERGWAMLAEGARLWPHLLTDLDTSYELACWDQPRGYRGEASLLDLERNADLVLSGLATLFDCGGPTLAPYRRRAYGLAYLAFAMLADQAGRWDLARRWQLEALLMNPRLATHAGVIRRGAKLLAGRRLTGLARTATRRPSLGSRRP